MFSLGTIFPPCGRLNFWIFSPGLATNSHHQHPPRSCHKPWDGRASWVWMNLKEVTVLIWKLKTWRMASNSKWPKRAKALNQHLKLLLVRSHGLQPLPLFSGPWHWSQSSPNRQKIHVPRFLSSVLYDAIPCLDFFFNWVDHLKRSSLKIHSTIYTTIHTLLYIVLYKVLIIPTSTIYLSSKQVHGFDMRLGCKPCAIRPFRGQQQVHTLTSSGGRDPTGLVERQQYLQHASFVEAHLKMYQVHIHILCVYIYTLYMVPYI